MPVKAKTPTKIHKQPPTHRQKKVIDSLVGNGGSLTKAMVKAGYSPQYAKNPKKFRTTASFKQLIDVNLPDWLLAEKHQEALEAQAVDSFVFPLAMEDEDIAELIKNWGFKLTRISHGQTNNRAYFVMPDHKIRLDAIKEGYKIKNKYEPEQIVVTKKYEDMTDEELQHEIDVRTERINKAKKG